MERACHIFSVRTSVWTIAESLCKQMNDSNELTYWFSSLHISLKYFSKWTAALCHCGQHTWTSTDSAINSEWMCQWKGLWVGVGQTLLYTLPPKCPQIFSQPIVLNFSHNRAVSSQKQGPYHGPEMTRLYGSPQHRLLRAGCTELEVSECSHLALLSHLW